MLLYHAISSYQLIEVILHKMRFNRNHICYLLISMDIVRKFKNVENLQEYFNEIIVYDNGVGNSILEKEENVSTYFNGIFAEAGVSINDFETLLVPCAHHSFGIYLAENKISFIFFEDASGTISRPEVLSNIEKKAPKKDQLCLEFGLYDGTNPYITKRYYNANTQLPGYSSDCYEHFDVVEELNLLSDQVRKELISFFISVDTLKMEHKSVLILTQHFANLSILTWEQQTLIYQLLVDYFLPDYPLVFKPHPDDLMYYELLFPECRVIREKFPSEFLPFMFAERPEIVATISSTAMYNIQQCFDRKLEFNFAFEKQFTRLHRYYTALYYAASLFDNGYVCHSVGVNTIILDNFNAFTGMGPKIAVYHETVEDLAEIPPKTVIIVDEVAEPETVSEDICKLLDNIPDEAVVIFINSKQNYCFFNCKYKHLWNNIHPIEITKQAHRTEEMYQELEPETIYVFMKGESCKMQRLEKDLKYTGVSIAAEEFEGDRLRIKVLEGILDATEKRLLYYIEQKQKLELELQKSKGVF